MAHSPRVLDAFAEATKVSDFITENQPTEGNETGRLHIAVALLSLATYHREAGMLLAHHDLWPSAFALQRPIWEAFTRGHHAVHCLSDKQYGLMVNHQASPKMETITKELQAIGPSYRGFADGKALVWEALSDYSHGGVRQVSRWLRTDVIEPHFTDDEKVEGMWFMDLYGLYASMTICELFAGPVERYAELAAHVHKRGEQLQRERLAWRGQRPA